MGIGTDIADKIFANNGASYDRIAMLCTLGLDIWWKNLILQQIPHNPSRIIDQACGTGILTLKIARRFPRCRVVGVEMHEDFLAVARQKAQALKLTNVEFILGRAEDVILEGGVDCITSSYLAKYAELDLLVKNARAMLRPGGVLIMHELTVPVNPVFAALWRLQFRFLQAYGTWRYPEWEVSFRELPLLVKETRWLEDLTTALAAEGFSNIRVKPQLFEVSAIVSAQK